MKEIQKNISGKEYWRSMDQLADTPEFQQFLEREFPENASEMTNPVSRRKFLGLMGASIAFAGLAGCRRPVEKIVPYVKAPENVVPGIPQYYATTATFGAHAYGLLVESHGGRPTKIEGNEKHPSSRGKTNAFLQAEILNLYDPDRAKEIMHEGEQSDWESFVAFWKEKHTQFAENQGEGLAVISGEFSSPTLHGLYSTFKKAFPKAIWVIDEPVSYANMYKGLQAATGKLLRPNYQFENAKVIVSLDNDFLGTGVESVSSNLGFAKGRRVESEKDEMNRLYVVESSFSITGGMSDHRKQLSQANIEGFARQLASTLGIANADTSVVESKWVNALVDDLRKNKGTSLVVAGHRQSAATHALVFAINEALKNNNATVTYHNPSYAVLEDSNLADFASMANSGKINTLVTIGSNPVYSAAADLNIAAALEKVETKISLAVHKDETAANANWLIPMSHFLESWGDAAALDGTLSVAQPLIQPLYNSKSNLEVLNLVVSGSNKTGHDLVQDTWKGLLKTSTLGKSWRKVLHDGLYEASNNTAPSVNSSAVSVLISDTKLNNNSLSKENLEVVFYASSSMYDGRFANNGWMQEAPDPVTKLCWDNAALINPRTAQELGVNSKDLVTLSVNGRSMDIVVSVTPGVADNVVALELGYGRKNIGRIADGAGFNVNVLRTSANSTSADGAKITKTGRTYALANTQDHNSMEERPLIREATLEQYRQHPSFAPDMVKHPPLESLFEDYSYEEGYQWGMTIDLNTCTGCNTCLVACQSENNIPVIGKEEVEKGREMHWIRLDRYFAGDVNDPEMVYQPVACQHCENAPCEQVCPVQATLHDEEGLNVMTYNRCVGTRYCANNCPYKVRRFNFFNYTNDYPETIKMAQNPDVTVRFRGVMEKCTYCTQRLQGAKITAKNEGRQAKDVDYVTACQQACPAEAIVFGNINDPESDVVKAKKQNRNYAMLGELNIRPRTTFMAKLRNPNPEIEKLIETVS
ncbi:MAG: TAT-variant-translocated molybdopterin oxidoreductase [Calditrichaeota bacterium]|nr:TAT-variant-translocated molybdopterin oxidoreductase [Calditrichota bacterium]